MRKFTYLLTSTFLLLSLVAFSQNEDATKSVDLGLGITKSAELNTSSVYSINSETILKSSSISLDDALFGKLLGLSVLQNGGFDNSNNSSYFIHGLKTLSNNGILIVVDGLERPVSDLALEEVESVSVLKDAAAVALYGFKGINGVLSIKTKRGLKQKLDVKVGYDHGSTSAFRLPKMVDGNTYALAYNEAMKNDGNPSSGFNTYEMGQIKNNSSPYLYPNVDWINETLRKNGTTDKISLGIRGGDSKVKYFTLLNLSNCSGLFANTEDNSGYSTQLKYSQANIRSNFDVDLTPTTKFQLNLLGVFYQSNQPSSMGADDIMSTLYQLPSTAFPIRAQDGNWGGSTTWTNKNPIANISGTGYGQNIGRTFYADMKFTQDLKVLTPGLSASIRVGYDNYANYWDKRVRGFRYEINKLTFDVNGIPGGIQQIIQGDNAGTLGFSVSLNNEWRNSNVQGSIDYQKSVGDNNFNASLLYSNQMYATNGQNNTYYRQNFSTYMHWDKKAKYMADLVLMMAGSNAMAYFPYHYGFSSVLSGGWIASKEEFLKSSKIVDFLKIRASAGILSSDNIPALTLTDQKFDGGGSYYFTDSYTSFSGTKEGQLGYPNPRLEKALCLNFGVDALLFKGLTINTDIFYQNRFDILQSGISSSVLGISAPYQNSGIVSSRGIDLGIDYKKSVGQMTLFLGGKYTYSKCTIDATVEEPKAFPYLSAIGNSVNQNYGLESIGFFKDQAEINAYPVDQSFNILKPGDIKYKDQNGDNIINENDVVPLGHNNSVPEIYYSFSIGLEYKNIGVDADFQGIGNFDKFVTTTGLFRPMTNGNNVSQYYYDNRWSMGNDNSTALFPSLSTLANPNNERNSSVWLQDLSYLKLRTCEIYYNLPLSLLKKVKLNKAKIYVRGMNLLSFDKLKIVDPENTGTKYPTTKSLNLGISLNF
ncbi:MAG: SusC/RagA family TonB-linked outer membrane protein [Prolixibacteraceae bacterium]